MTKKKETKSPEDWYKFQDKVDREKHGEMEEEAEEETKE